MKNPTGIPQATAFALSTLGITLSLSSGDHFQSASAAGCQTGKRYLEVSRPPGEPLVKPGSCWHVLRVVVPA